MANATTLNIDLNDPRSADIAEILSNKTCRKILSLIAEKELTETEISSKLKIALNTVDYNIKKLVKAGLIESTSHFWSVRGKKMPSYRVSERKIIISPKSFSSKVLTLPIVSSLGVLFVLGKRFFPNQVMSEQIAAKSADVAGETNLFMASAPVVSDSATRCIGQVGERCGDIVNSANSFGFFSNFSSWEWVLIGIWIGSVLFLLSNLVIERRRK